MTELDHLNDIKAFGRVLYQGQQFQVKYRLKASAELNDKLLILKRKYPELHIHRSEEKGSVIFGGTFSKLSNFLYEAQLIRSRC